MAYKISGRVLFIGPSQILVSKSGSQYSKREVVIAVRKFDPYTGQPNEERDNTPKFTFFGQQCQQLDTISNNDIVVIHFDLSGRSYDKEGKTEYFTEVRPFRIESSSGNSSQAVPAASVPEQSNPFGLINPSTIPAPSTEAISVAKTADDDLPF